MNAIHRLRFPTVVMFCLCQAPAFAQEPPVETPPPEAVAPESVPPAEAAPAVEAAAAPEAATTPEAPPGPESAPQPGLVSTGGSAPAVKRIVMLPVEFTVYQKSVAGIEAVPDWSETARFSLGQAAIEMLKKDDRFQVVDAPEFDGETKGLLREHVELFKIVGDTATSLLQWGGRAWADKKTNFDYTLGDGLQFLADASGADYAFLLAGAQITQTGGDVFKQLFAAALGVALPGGGTFMFTGIVDLRTGDVKWLNSKLGQQLFGITGSDVRDPATASEIVTRLFEGFPMSKLVNFPQF